MFAGLKVRITELEQQFVSRNAELVQLQSAKALMIDEMTTVLDPSPLADFVETKYIKDITNNIIIFIIISIVSLYYT